MARSRRPVAERFWAMVDKNGPVIRPELGPCWIWKGATTDGGYGVFDTDGGQTTAHRVAWVLTNGPMPAGHQACHRCDNPPCVRPDHVFPGTSADNHTDAVSKGRVPSGEGHYHASLTNGQVEEIRRRRLAGESTPTLATAFGVSSRHIRHLVAGTRRAG